MRSLMKHMEIHARGDCLLNYERVGGKPGDRGIFLEKAQQYKFVFAIENSLCIDYVTEKICMYFKRCFSLVGVYLLPLFRH